jgi:hypothetical protein
LEGNLDPGRVEAYELKQADLQEQADNLRALLFAVYATENEQLIALGLDKGVAYLSA